MLGAPKKRFSNKDLTGKARRSRSPLQGQLGFGLILCAVVLMMELMVPSVMTRSKQALSNMAMPAMSVALIPVDISHRFLSDVRSMAEYRVQLQQMDEENKRLRSWIQTAMMLESENKRLREIANMGGEPDHNFITASILIDGSSAYARTLLIKTDQEKAVQKGQGVITDRGLVGRVIEANGDTARILLVDDINSRIPVVIEQTGDRAILAGRNDETPALDHLPDHHQVKQGMRVVTSGHGGVFPYGVPVGVVDQVTDQGAYAVRLYVDPGKAHFVQVVNYDIDPNTIGRSFAASGFGYRTLN